MKTRVFSIVMALLIMLMASSVLFADPSDLDTWSSGATNTGTLGKAEQSAKNLGLAFDKLITLVGRIAISLVVSWLGIKFVFNKNATSKTGVKEQIPYILGGAVLLYFGTDILKMVLVMFQSAFFK